MQEFLQQNINWLKTLHVISVIAWMAGQLYLPRLFVYHVGAVPGGELSKTLKIMERRLLKIIMLPAMMATLFFGALLVFASPDLATQGWFHIKMLGVFTLLLIHGLCARTVKIFAADQNTRSAKFYRLINEIPTLAMILVVVCSLGLRTIARFI